MHRGLRAALLVLSLAACDKVKSLASPPSAPAPVASAASSSVASSTDAGLAPQASPDDAVAAFTSNPRGVKDVLSKRVHGEKPSPDDARLLLAVCTNLHDDACVADCQMILGTPAPKASAAAAPAVSPEYEQAKKIAAKDPKGAKNLLLPRVQAGVSTDDEENLLEQVCKKLKDKDCLKAVADARNADAPKPGGRSVTDQARDALLTNPALAKTLLMPVVASGRGSPEDVRLLKAACEGLRDSSCLDFVKNK